MIRAFATTFLILLTTAPVFADTVIAFWDFNDHPVVDDETSQIVHAPSMGNGVLYQQRADTDGNGKGGVAFNDPTLGIDVIDGRSMAWDDIAKTGDNDAEFFVEFSTVGYTTIQVRLDIRGNGEGNDEIVSYDLKYDLDPLANVNVPDVIGTIKDFSGGTSIELLNNQSIPANGTTFISETIDLSGLTEINNQPVVAIRFDDFRENDSMRIDNVLISGVTAIPEPSSIALLCVLGTVPMLRRRR